jgi:hypothetical protein
MGSYRKRIRFTSGILPPYARRSKLERMADGKPWSLSFKGWQRDPAAFARKAWPCSICESGSNSHPIVRQIVEAEAELFISGVSIGAKP